MLGPDAITTMSLESDWMLMRCLDEEGAHCAEYLCAAQQAVIKPLSALFTGHKMATRQKQSLDSLSTTLPARDCRLEALVLLSQCRQFRSQRGAGAGGGSVGGVHRRRGGGHVRAAVETVLG